MVVWCKLKVPSLRITVWHHSASLAMLNNYRRDTIFNPQLTAITNSYNKENVQCSNICYTRIWDIFVHTYVTYKYVIWPNLCYTQKYNIVVCLHFFYICKCIMSFSVLLFSEFGQMHIKKLRGSGSNSIVFKTWTSALPLLMINDIWQSLCLAHVNSNVYQNIQKVSRDRASFTVY